MSALAIEMPALNKSSLRQMRGLLAELLWYWGRQPLYYVWIAKCRWPKLVSWFWCMVHRAEWQKSTAQSTFLWVAATPVIFDVAQRMGNGVVVSVAISFAVDLVVFGLNKLWIWHKRDTSVPNSGARNVAIWVTTFGINILLAVLVIGHIGLHDGRYALGVYGVFMNPVMFKVRDRFVFAETNLLEIASAIWRRDRAKDAAAGHLARWRTGGM